MSAKLYAFTYKSTNDFLLFCNFLVFMKKKNSLSIEVYFGVPGSGKSTVCAAMINKARRRCKCYSNFPVKGAYLIDSRDIGKYEIGPGEMYLDEAGVYWNSRKFKSMPMEAVEYFKLARKHGVSRICVFSQRFDDMDLSIRAMATSFYRVHKRGLWIIVKRIVADTDIDKDTHQIIYSYRWALELPRIYFAPLYWRLFDSYAVDKLEWKEFPLVQ